MIKKLILINSANFNFLEVSLEKDLFFLGDNGSGKTTVIRAIHYLFSGDVRNLGIPSDKDGFKEYYFKYANSYMIYVFEEFFIFTYKSGGEIVKIFSKQKFDIFKVMDEKRELFELDEIRRYVRSPNLKKTVKSLGEYREIIYGNNRQYLDFKFTSIKNNEIFLGLFNEIFNIDKSIIDSKSIKKAIQTTLDYEKKVIDFDHEEYLQKIYEFKSEYRFFKEFEKQKKNIDEAFALKESLLSLEEVAIELRAFMAYRVAFEREELQKAATLALKMDADLNATKEFYKRSAAVLSKCEKRFRELFNALALEARRIKALKEKFSQESALVARDRADRHEEILARQSELNQSYIKLKSGFESELDSIKKELEELTHKRDKELVREFDGKVFNKTQLLQNELSENEQKEELAFATRQNVALLSESEVREEITQFEADVKSAKSLVSAALEERETFVKKSKASREKEEDKKRAETKLKEESIDAKRREIRNFKLDLEDVERLHLRETRENESVYASELGELTKEIKKYQSMTSAKPNSFKEFLHEEVDGWESELYPVLDETLLDMSLDELKPKLLSQSKLFAIELNKEGLKSILTKEEAEKKTQALRLQEENLEISYMESTRKIESKRAKSREALEEKEGFAIKEIELLRDEINAMEERTLEQTRQLALKLQEAIHSYETRAKRFHTDIKNLERAIVDDLQVIETIHKELRVQRNAVNEAIKDLREAYLEDLSQETLKLKTWLRDEQKKIDELVKRKEEQKYKITKDERVKELETSLFEIDKELSESLLAKEFLAEYEKSKEEISELPRKESELENVKLKNEEFKKRLETKLENYEYKRDELLEAKKSFASRDKKLKKGASEFELLDDDFELATAKESDAFLHDLVEKYKSLIMEYKSKKVNLKTTLDKINALKNSQNEIEINFKFVEYDSVLFISATPNVIAQLDDVVEYKNKKLEMVKRSGHKKFINFVNNLLPQKMSIFNDSEDKFFSQVAKINKNLSEIDFGVIKNIKIDTQVGDKKSVAKLLGDLSANVANLSSLLNESSLFYDKDEVLVELNRLEMKFKEIKLELKGNSISLQDTIDLSLSFNENGKQIAQVSQLKNESSTGGSMLLKIAIAVSILKLFIKEDETPFFLIVDEVSRLHSDNQEKLRTFANSKGFGIVFVTPEPTYSKPEAIKYYRFRKNADDEFEAVELNL